MKLSQRLIEKDLGSKALSITFFLCDFGKKMTFVLLCLTFKMMIIVLSCRIADKLNETIHGKC